jgi:hypothetical protein
MKMEQSVPKRRYIKFSRRGITQKKAYNVKLNLKFRCQYLSTVTNNNFILTDYQAMDHQRKRIKGHKYSEIAQPVAHTPTKYLILTK